MSAFAKRVSAVFVHSGAKANDFIRLNHLDICMSHDQVIRDEVEAGKYTFQRCCCGKSRQLVNGFVCCQRFTYQPIVFLRCEANAYFIGSGCAGSLSFFFSGCLPRFSRLAASPLTLSHARG